MTPAPRAIGQRGAVAIEYALVLPVLLLFLLGIMDVGRLAWSQATLDYAASAAARCASFDTLQCGTTAQIQTYGVSKAYAMNLATSNFTVTSAACGLQVSVSAPFDFVTPWISPANITLAANACYPTQS